MNKIIEKKILNSAKNGVITSKIITEMGIHRSALQELVAEGKIKMTSRGIYLLADEWEDEYFLLQQKYNRGIFSHSTALYLHGFSDRVPLSFHMTFPAGYNSPSLKKENVIVTRVKETNYEEGIITLKTPFGNKVKVYDLERTLCDVMRGSNLDIETVQSSMKAYSGYKNKDINRLLTYAKKLRVEPKIRKYLEVLL
ncbi:MAG: type IV toxin-antitoxin system AbiEi family antitoxin domain-containing protein [Eubacterium sp.]|nr:type IV toxin-antitoxin system AbiEi family antitoxin domain-containing protein [Eubacterium sp.]